MWVMKLPDNRFKYIERYKAPYTDKDKRVSTILTSDSTQAFKKAQKILDERIKIKLNDYDITDKTFHRVLDEWYIGYKKPLHPSSISATNSEIKKAKQYIDEDVLISRMNARYIQKFMDELDYSNVYLAHIKLLLNHIFNMLWIINL